MPTYDTSIFQGVRPRSVADYSAEMDAADERKIAGQSNRLQLMLQQGQLDQAQQAQNDDKALRMLYADPTFNLNDPTGQRRAMAVSPRGAQALIKANYEAQKAGADVGKTVADTGKTQQEIVDKAFGRYKDMLGTVQDPQQAEAFIRASNSDPVLGKLLSQYGSVDDRVNRFRQAASQPGGFEQWRAQASLGLGKLAELAKVSQVDTGGTTNTQVFNPATGIVQTVATQAKTQSPDNIASNATQRRGQDITDRRARETADAALTKPFEVTGPDGAPMLVQQDKQGNLRRVEGFGPKTGASKPLTEGQAKANLFGTRMQEANDILDKMAAQGVTRPSLLKQAAESVPIIGGGLAMAANAATSPEQQQVEQAQRDFVNAVLRRESGAAIAESEFKSAEKQYFPQPNDSPEVIAQKRRNRLTAIQGLMAEVPAGARTKPAPSGATGDWSAPAGPAQADPKGRPPLSSFGGR